MYILLNKEGRIIARSDIKQNNFIEIEDEKIQEISKANIYDYLYINNKFIYKPIEVDLKKVLEEVKAQKREELKVIRDKKIRDNISLYGAEFQVRNDTDIENFKDVERGLDKGFKQLTDKRMWILADNTIREFTYEQLSKVLDKKAERKEEIFNKFGLLTMQLDACKTVEEIEAIKWL